MNSMKEEMGGDADTVVRKISEPNVSSNSTIPS